MNLLVDTHVWIWSALEPDRLGRKAAAALGSPKNVLWLSPMSVWELLLLAGRGRLRLNLPSDRWIAESLESAPMRDAPVTREVALETRHLPGSLTDPVDRILAATARVYGLTLATADQRLLGLRELPVLDAG